MPALDRMIIDVGAEEARQQDARADAGGPKLDDRRIRGDAVDDHRDRRRDEIVERAFGGDQRRGEAFAVARLAHARIGQRADRRGRRRSHARGRAEQGGKAERRERNIGAEAADQRADAAQQPHRDAAARHQTAGKNEERHGQQRIFVQAVEDVLGDHGHRDIEEAEQDHERGDQQQQKDRKAEQQQRKRQDPHHPIHGCAPLNRTCRKCTTATARSPPAP